ncbi:MAG TPA: cobalamin biosynthesis protein [Coleofasciculaceae cyanobacterium]
MNNFSDSVQAGFKDLWVGIGYQRGTLRTSMETAIQEVCRTHDLAEAAIAGLATLDRKVEAPALVELCRDRQWVLCGFSADQLRSISVPNPSAIVGQEVGTLSVCEAAAILASRQGGGAENLGLHSLCVTKKIFHPVGQSGAVTVAIAQAKLENS